MKSIIHFLIYSALIGIIISTRLTLKQTGDKRFNIISNGNLCVSANNKDGRLTQQKCGLEKELIWFYIYENNSRIIQSENGLVMDNEGGKDINGNPVLGYSELHRGFNQQWNIMKVNENVILIRNVQSGKCLDNTGNVGVGKFYHIWDCDVKNKNQWFQIREIPSNAVFIQGKTGLCISASTENGKLVQKICDSTPDMLFVRETLDGKTGITTITSLNGLAIEYSGKHLDNGTPIIGDKNFRRCTQTWYIIHVKGDQYLIQSGVGNRCVDDTGVAKEGNNYHLWSCDAENRNQYFRFAGWN